MGISSEAFIISIFSTALTCFNIIFNFEVNSMKFCVSDSKTLYETNTISASWNANSSNEILKCKARKKHWHNGIDIGVKHPQTIVYCTADGVVEELDYNSSKGAYITIKHADDFQTKYFHLDNIFIRRGEEVRQGQKIGVVGNTGKSTATHLHYEIHFKGDAIDPLLLNH